MRTRLIHQVIWLMSLTSLLTPECARAQSSGGLATGTGFSIARPGDSHSSQSMGPSLLWRLAGYAFTSFSLGPAAEEAYRVRAASVPETSASNVFVLKPELSTWIDLAPKVGLNINVGYMIARPEISLRTEAGEERRRIRADRLMLKVGVAYSVF